MYWNGIRSQTVHLSTFSSSGVSITTFLRGVENPGRRPLRLGAVCVPKLAGFEISALYLDIFRQYFVYKLQFRSLHRHITWMVSPTPRPKRRHMYTIFFCLIVTKTRNFSFHRWVCLSMYLSEVNCYVPVVLYKKCCVPGRLLQNLAKDSVTYRSVGKVQCFFNCASWCISSRSCQQPVNINTWHIPVAVYTEWGARWRSG